MPTRFSLLLSTFLLPLAASAGDQSTSTADHAHCAVGAAEVSPWPEANLDSWQTREFKGASEYRLVDIDGQRVLDARTEGAASVLYRERSVDLSDTPIVSWSWLVDHVYDNPNEQSKAGDDFPARLYVVIQTGFLPWDTHAINYVFASEAPQESAWLNPYTDKAMMIAVRSGKDDAGRWHCEQRNVAEDFARAFPDVFPEPPTKLSGYALMVDGDNGGHSGQAYFGGINFQRADTDKVAGRVN